MQALKIGKNIFKFFSEKYHDTIIRLVHMKIGSFWLTLKIHKSPQNKWLLRFTRNLKKKRGLTIFHQVPLGRVVGHQLRHVGRHRPAHGRHRSSPQPFHPFVPSDFRQRVEHVPVVASALLGQTSVGRHPDHGDLDVKSLSDH